MKEISKLLFNLIVISITLILNNCKPEDEGKTYGPYRLDEGRDYLYFKPGSWWVYQNNLNGSFDTLVLKSINLSMREFVGKNTVIKDIINFNIVSSTTGYEYKYYMLTPNPDSKPDVLKTSNFISILHGKSKAGDYQGEAVTFFYPFDSSHISGTGSHNTYYKTFYSELTLKGKSYYSVRKFYLDHDATWESWWVNYYWAKDVGLIKRENIKLGESWELVNYKVIKQ